MNMLSTLVTIILATGAVQAEEPNVILVMTDDQGYGDLGFHGNPILRTPNLDRFAGESVRLSDFYVHPVCAPTRASLMTGRWCQRTSAIDTYRGRAMLEPEEVTLAEMLHAEGYATGVFGKWHLGDCHPVRAIDQGFDDALVHRGGGIGQPSDPRGGEGRYTDPILFRNDERVETSGYCTDVYMDEAIDWMSRQHEAGRPFFAYIPTNAPHGPYGDVPEEPYRRYAAMELSNDDFPQEHGHPIAKPIRPDLTAREYAMIENIDGAMGRLLASLEEKGLAENTIVLFMHDNGPQHLRYNAGFRSNKGSVYEGGIRSPLFIRWPARLQGGRTVDGLGAHVDIAPTILDACGASQDIDPGFDGESLLPMLEGRVEQAPDRTIVIQAHRGDVPVAWHNAMIRMGDWKLVNDSGFGREIPPGEKPRMRLELYNLEDDPYEEHDLASANPEMVQKLRAAYEAWFKDVGADDPGNYLPPRISVGHPDAARTVLTRQDWRGAGWGDRARGHWLIDVARDGAYQVRVRPCVGTRWPEPTAAVLKIGPHRLEGTFKAGAPEIVFEHVLLPAGPSTLEVDVTDEQGTLGAYQVVVEPGSTAKQGGP